MYRQGDAAQLIYIAKSGEFEAVRTSRKFDSSVNSSGDKKLDFRMFIGPAISSKKAKLSENKMNKDLQPTLSDTKISLICQGQLFGVEDVLHGRDHTVTVKCVSNKAQVYSIPAAEFMQKIKRDERTQLMIREMSFNRDLKTRDKIRGAAILKKLEQAGQFSKFANQNLIEVYERQQEPKTSRYLSNLKSKGR